MNPGKARAAGDDEAPVPGDAQAEPGAEAARGPNRKSGEEEPGAPQSGGESLSAGTPPPEPSEEEVFYCDLCGSVMLNLHCKLICERCGYRRDCSDP